MKESYEKRDLLIKSGKEEFLKHGFEKASLREMCSNAGVTTGALYFFFKNKADLFDTIVRDTAIELQKRMDEMSNSDLSLNERHDMIDKVFEEFATTSREEIMLLFGRSDGTKYEGYQNRIESQVTDVMHSLLESHLSKEINREVVELLTEMRFQCYTSIIRRHSDADAIRKIMRMMSVYRGAGFKEVVSCMAEDTL